VDLTVLTEESHELPIGPDPLLEGHGHERVIQREIGDRAAVLILEGTVVEGGTITVDAGSNVDGEPTLQITTSG